MSLDHEDKDQPSVHYIYICKRVRLFAHFSGEEEIEQRACREDGDGEADRRQGHEPVRESDREEGEEEVRITTLYRNCELFF